MRIHAFVSMCATVADPGGDPGVQRNPPFLAKMNLTHGGVCSLSKGRRRYLGHDDQFSDVGTLRCVGSSLLGATTSRMASAVG